MRKRFQDFCTVKKLKEFIEKHNISDDTIIVMERVEDRYFTETSGWADKELQMKGESYYNCLEHNKKVDGEFLDKEQYPDMTPEFLVKYTEEDLERSKTQYYPAWCPVYYKENTKYLFLDAHY